MSTEQVLAAVVLIQFLQVVYLNRKLTDEQLLHARERKMLLHAALADSVPEFQRLEREPGELDLTRPAKVKPGPPVGLGG